MKSIYVAGYNHKFLKSYAKQNGDKMNVIADKIIAAGIKVLKLKLKK